MRQLAALVLLTDSMRQLAASALQQAGQPERVSMSSTLVTPESTKTVSTLDSMPAMMSVSIRSPMKTISEVTVFLIIQALKLSVMITAFTVIFHPDLPLLLIQNRIKSDTSIQTANG